MYLFSRLVRRSNEPVALANYGRVLAATNGIHKPMSVVVVDDMEKSPPAPWHPLNQPLPEMVESQSYLHHFILRVTIT